ncbi:hypothetical protein FD754_022591 [Muntiacus muntjak]|uniref:Uncharacterized protein n=1 Tax=Muntiacus muntjak TaxID=9888 RepID=A0A5N3V972_MUNMU|nr:hypothetical protein FD754_022591 [Muntiacus muntjak]
MVGGDMAKCTKKVGIMDKYGTHYGASLRKMVKKFEISQHAKHTYSFGRKRKEFHSLTATIYCSDLWRPAPFYPRKSLLER